MFVYIPLNSRAWLLRTRNGQREASWRMWLLVFLLPICFLGASFYLSVSSMYFLGKAKSATGEVTRVYDWPQWTPWTGDTTVYSPVFRYKFTDGTLTQASTGQSSANWNFEPGSKHTILYDPGRKGDVKLENFETLWALPLIIAGFAIASLLPAGLGAASLLWWLKGGREPASCNDM